MELGLRVSSGFQRENDLNCDAHRDDGKRFVVRADERLTAFLELERQVSKDAERVERQLSLSHLCDAPRISEDGKAFVD